ncbi:MAG: phosphodiester glycosidase family protein [Chthoniobacterales bacterium]
MNRFFFLISLFLATVGRAASAEWQVVKNKTLGTLPAAAVMKSIALSQASHDGVPEEVQLTVVIFSEKNYRLAVIDVPKRDQSLQQVMSGNEFVAGINGGYFHPDNKPLGLLMHDGKVIHAQERARLLSGFLVSNGHELELLRVAEKMPSGPLDVLQAGPFLVDRGESVVGLEATKVAWRSFLASDGHGDFAMGVISPVTLAGASTILLAAAPDIFSSGSLQRALNLDGGSSTAFWAALQPAPFLLHGYVQVRNFLGLQLR